MGLAKMPYRRSIILAALMLVLGDFLEGQDATESRDLLISRVGDLAKLRVPAEDSDFPQPRLPGGELDPRFKITPEKVYLGKLLFFDPVRSNHIQSEFGGLPETAQTSSCGSCHIGEAATKAGIVTSLGVGGLGRHEMNAFGYKVITRTVMGQVEDILPSGVEMIGEDGTVLASGSFDAVDSPGRVAPSAIGFAFNNRLLWGGEAGEPNPEEYPAQEDIVRKASMAHRMANPDYFHLQRIDAYRYLFARAFPDENAEQLESGNPDDLINLDTQVRAIAAFLRTVITRDTPWDRFLAGDDSALRDGELRGAWLFAAPVEEGGANCIACHSGPALNKTLGDEEGLLVEENFHNLGTLEHPLQQLVRDTFGNQDSHDVGRHGVTKEPGDAYEFKTPTLRQVRDADPYFHGGEAKTLRDAVEYHLAGLAANPLAAAAGNLSELFTSPRGEGITGLDLSADDIGYLIEFLKNALYDEGLVKHDPDSSTPTFELNREDLTYSEELKALGAVDGWLPSGLPNGFADSRSREQLVFVRGNVNGDVVVDISDAIALLKFFFVGGPEPQPMVSGDVNDDSEIDISDPIYLLRFLFLENSPLPAPYPEPGQDLTF